jgi:hypothetical protein
LPESWGFGLAIVIGFNRHFLLVQMHYFMDILDNRHAQKSSVSTPSGYRIAVPLHQ